MLNKNPVKRSTAEELLDHKFIKQVKKEKVENQEVVMKDIKRFCSRDLLYQSCFSYIAFKSGYNKQIDNLRKTFEFLDNSKDNMISKEELLKGFKKCDYFSHSNVLELNLLFDTIDTNGNSRVDFEEFVSACIKVDNEEASEKLKLAFDFFDSDSNGKICINELKTALLYKSRNLNIDTLYTIMNKMDLNRDGYVDFNEFIKMLDDILFTE